MILPSSLTMNSLDHDPSLQKRALRSGSLTKLLMPDGVDVEYNTLYAMRDMERNMMNGGLDQKWRRQTPWIDGKMRMGLTYEGQTNFLRGEGCKPAPPPHRLTTHRHATDTPTSMDTPTCTHTPNTHAITATLAPVHMVSYN
jgi:hypothetical protein